MEVFTFLLNWKLINIDNFLLLGKILFIVVVWELIKLDKFIQQKW